MAFIRTRTRIVFTLLCAVALYACLQSSAPVISSTSVTTGNPTGIRIIFRKDSLPISLNGKVEVFATTQIPVPGYSPDPLLKINLVEASDVEIEESSIQAIPDSLWPAKSIEGDSVRKFNVVISSDSLGSILEGFHFQKNKHGALITQSGAFIPQINLHSEITVSLDRLTGC